MSYLDLQSFSVKAVFSHTLYKTSSAVKAAYNNMKTILQTAAMRPFQSSPSPLSLCLISAAADSAGGGPAGGGRRRPLRRGQHAGGGTQDAGPGAGEGITEAQQARYPGDLRRRHPAAGAKFIFH